MALIRKTCPNCCGQGRFRDYSYESSQMSSLMALTNFTICWKCDGKGYIDEDEEE